MKNQDYTPNPDEIRELMTWLVEHPPHQSSAFIKASLKHCMATMSLEEDQIRAFVQKMEDPEVIQGIKLPEAPTDILIFQTFLAFIRRLKNAGSPAPANRYQGY